MSLRVHFDAIRVRDKENKRNLKFEPCRFSKTVMLGRFVFVVCAETITSSGVFTPNFSRQADGSARNNV